MKHVYLWVVVLLLAVPFVFSFNCNSVSDSSYCLEVQQSSLSSQEKDVVYASLLYQDVNYPNHEFVREYNQGLNFWGAPDGVTTYNAQFIKNAWFALAWLTPSVYNGSLLVPSEFTAQGVYHYTVDLPENYHAGSYPTQSQGDCKRTYQLQNQQTNIVYYVNGAQQSNPLRVTGDSTISSELNILVEVLVKHYHWQEYSRGRYRCVYHHSDTERGTSSLSDEKDVVLYDVEPSVNVEKELVYGNTTQLHVDAQDYSSFTLAFDNGYYTERAQSYGVTFSLQPYHVAQLTAYDTRTQRSQNVYVDDTTLYVLRGTDCLIDSYNHFYNIKEDCNLDENESEIANLSIEKKDLDFSVLMQFLVFLGIIYLIYKALKSQWKKVVPMLFSVLLFMPGVLAADDTSCGLTNLSACLPDILYQFILALINAPLAPLLIFVEKLLTGNVGIEIFFSLWSIVRILLSVFYLFFLLYAGYTLVVSGANPIKRAQAKEMLKNALLMIILIQGSYYLYGLLINLSSVMSSSIIQLVPPEFFLLTANNFTNIGLEFAMSSLYFGTLLATTVMLVIRYIIVATGVVVLPIGLFCYFVPPLRGYGKFIISVLGLMLFIPFLNLLIILGCSMLINDPLFASMEIIVMVVCFSIVNLTLWIAVKFALKGAATSSVKDDLNQAVKYLALLA